MQYLTTTRVFLCVPTLTDSLVNSLQSLTSDSHKLHEENMSLHKENLVRKTVWFGVYCSNLVLLAMSASGGSKK